MKEVVEGLPRAPSIKRDFKYIGIPLVGQGYQTAHIKGTRALLSFLPLTIKGGTARGPLRDAFLCAAAVLLYYACQDVTSRS